MMSLAFSRPATAGPGNRTGARDLSGNFADRRVICSVGSKTVLRARKGLLGRCGNRLGFRSKDRARGSDQALGGVFDGARGACRGFD